MLGGKQLMGKSRTKKLFLNTAFSIILEIVTLLCGLILPRLILGTFGSNINGLVNSITQFLAFISFLDLGVGAVVQSAFYKPLADNDTEKISQIYLSAQKFFKKIAFILILYIVILMFIYPIIIRSDFSFVYIDILIVVISISSFSQYYLGIVNTLLLNADQKNYVQYIISIISMLFNIMVCYFLIKMNCSIQIVKLLSSIVLAIKPLCLNIYVKKKYNINKVAKYNEEPIKQKWNGMAQHFAHIVLVNTDTIVLTLFSSLTNVSIYTVYNYIIVGVKNLLTSLTNGFLSLMGNMYAREEIKKLYNFFGYVEWFLHNITVLLFGCTAVLIVNFVRIYTLGITDANYIQPLFGILITIANAIHCLRLPYNNLIKAAGHYKQTQNNFIIAMFLNIIISVVTVKMWGLIGVTIGTLIAMLYQTIWMSWYISKNIINWPLINFYKQLFVDFIIVVISFVITYNIPMSSTNYFSWSILAAEVFMVWLCFDILFNLIFYRDKTCYIFLRIKNKIIKSKKGCKE